MLRHENEEAAIITTPWDEIGKEAIMHAFEHEELAHVHGHDEHCDCGHHHHHEHHHEHGEHCACGCHHDHEHHHHHHADEVFTSWGKETVHKYGAEELEAVVKALAESDEFGTVLRAKGIVAMQDGSWKQFDLVPGEAEIREGKADYTGRICVIGTDLKEAELVKAFHI